MRPKPCILCLLLLARSTSFLSAADVERVIHISIDGLGGIALANLVHTSPAQFPAFSRLEAEGAFTYNARTDYTHTETVPNHSSMVTGRPVSLPTGLTGVHHGITSNFPMASQTLHNSGGNAGVYKSGTFDVVHDRGLGTAFYASKDRMAAFVERSYNATNGAVDAVDADNGRDKIDVYFNENETSVNVVAQFRSDSAATPRTYTFLHIVEPDEVGHESGWDTPAWNDAVEETDVRIASVLDFVTTDPAYVGKTAIVLTADHGGTGSGHSQPSVAANYTVPFFLWGPGIPAGVDLYGLFTNRFDPGQSRPDYTASQQPIRNGDSGNLSLGLLGLPAIPGSFMTPTLTIPTNAKPGDANGDGAVDNADAVILAKNYGMAMGATFAEGDFDNDGRINLRDLRLLNSHFDAPMPAGLAGFSIVTPEPSSWVLVWVGAVLVVGLRRRHVRSAKIGCRSQHYARLADARG